jgi:hypothetical protein
MQLRPELLPAAGLLRRRCQAPPILLKSFPKTLSLKAFRRIFWAVVHTQVHFAKFNPLGCGSTTSPIELKRRNGCTDAHDARSFQTPLKESSFPTDRRRRDGRVAEGARLESVFRGNSNVGSNPTLSASTFVIYHLDVVTPRLIPKIRKGSPVNREVNVTKCVKTLQGLRYCPVILSANGSHSTGLGSGQWKRGAASGGCLLTNRAKARKERSCQVGIQPQRRRAG